MATHPHFIETYTGKVINPLEPDPAQICIEDIAHSLSNQCRFTGHTANFYSVAQHSAHVSNYLASTRVSTTVQLQGLLHDAAEAYLSDVSRPVKIQPAFSSFYESAEERLMLVICRVFGLDWPFNPLVKVADNILLRSEARDLLPNGSRWWETGQVLDFTIRPVDPWSAEGRFMARFSDLTGVEGLTWSRKTAQ